METGSQSYPFDSPVTDITAHFYKNEIVLVASQRDSQRVTLGGATININTQKKDVSNLELRKSHDLDILEILTSGEQEKQTLSTGSSLLDCKKIGINADQNGSPQAYKLKCVLANKGSEIYTMTLVINSIQYTKETNSINKSILNAGESVLDANTLMNVPHRTLTNVTILGDYVAATSTSTDHSSVTRDEKMEMAVVVYKLGTETQNKYAFSALFGTAQQIPSDSVLQAQIVQEKRERDLLIVFDRVGGHSTMELNEEATLVIGDYASVSVSTDVLEVQDFSLQNKKVVFNQLFTSDVDPANANTNTQSMQWLWGVIIVVLIVLISSGVIYYFVAARSKASNNFAFKERLEVDEEITASEYSRL